MRDHAPGLVNPSVGIPAVIGHQAPLGYRRASGAPERTVPLNPAITIFETNNVIELSGACLKDDGVL
jgi:hypothetical protein